MEIALIANNAKKELMVQFCIAYCGVLAKHHICSTKVTGKMVSEATGLPVEQLVPGKQGGTDQIASRIAYNEIDILLYFRDGNADYNELLTDNNLIRECDINNIPVGTNIATAETIICALERGDLEWRNFINPNSEYNRQKREKEMENHK
ncbi:MAG: methylglyoxal synthase [Ruminococcus sp.]|nr:methylglyoxal synthase [Candidatus Apopatosoma intestinale]